MSKTIDDLVKIGRAARTAYIMQHQGVAGVLPDAERAATIAIVRALRDEMQTHCYTHGEPECCGRGVPNYNNTGEECCGAPTMKVTDEIVIGMFNEILGDAEEKVAADAISQKEGEVHDGRISQSLSTTGAPRNEVVGRHQGPSRGAIQHDSGNPDDTGNFTGEDETGRSGNVGCEIGHSLNEKVAGGADRKDAHAQLGSQQAHTPATDPSDGVAQRIERGVSTSDVAGSSPAAVATNPAPDVCVWTKGDTRHGGMFAACNDLYTYSPYHKGRCPSCGKPIRFVEGK